MRGIAPDDERRLPATVAGLIKQRLLMVLPNGSALVLYSTKGTVQGLVHEWMLGSAIVLQCFGVKVSGTKVIFRSVHAPSSPTYQSKAVLNFPVKMSHVLVRQRIPTSGGFMFCVGAQLQWRN